MPNTQPSPGGFSAAEIDQRLRKGLFVKSGDIVKAFGLRESEFRVLVPSTFPPVKNGQFRYRRFLRSQVMEVARAWEHAGR